MTPECDGVEDMWEDVSGILTWYYAHQTTVSIHDHEGDCFLFTTFSGLIHDDIVEESHVDWVLRCWGQSFEVLVAFVCLVRLSVPVRSSPPNHYGPLYARKKGARLIPRIITLPRSGHV